MSRLVISYCCSHCDFRGWDVSSWGPMEYVLPDGQRLHVETRLGWCHACQRPEAVEVLDLDARRADLDAAEDRLAEMGGEHFRANVLHALPGPWRRRLAEWARQAIACIEKRAVVGMLEQRQSPPRCLHCGSTDVFQPLDPRAELRPMDQPWRTGFQHPGCEGEILGACDGMRISLKSRVRTYTPEGERLPGAPETWEFPDDDQVIADVMRRGMVSGLVPLLSSTGVG